MSKMCVSYYTQCFIGYNYYCFHKFNYFSHNVKLIALIYTTQTTL